MVFVGVEFTEDNSVALVSDSWLTPLKKEVFWPPYKQQAQFNRALRNHVEADENNWQLYSISRCFFECENYEKARAKIKKTEVTSDILSDVDDLNTKRKRSVSKRLLYGSSDDDSNDTINNSSQFERPPIIKVKKAKTVGEVSKPLMFVSESTTIRRQGNDIGNVPDNQHISDVKLTPSSSSSSLITTISDDWEGLAGAVSQKKLFSLLYQVKEQNIQILELLKQQNLPTKVYNLPENFPIKLPITYETINALEEYLQNNENFSALRSYLSTLGGRDLTTKVNRILKTVLSDAVASNFSLFGKRQNKQAFYKLTLKKVIIDAIKSDSPNSYEKDIEDSIKVWLKHAPQRIKLFRSKLV